MATDGRILLKRDEDPPVSLNNTSMTDVIFIFLIFFISLSQIRTSSVDVKLPSVASKSEPRRESGKPVVIEVSKEDGIYVDGLKVEPADLPGRVAALRASEGEEPRVRIRSDEESRSGRLVAVIAALADAGLTKVEFEVKVRVPVAPEGGRPGGP